MQRNVIDQTGNMNTNKVFAQVLKSDGSMINIYQRQCAGRVSNHKDQWVLPFLKCPWETYNPQFFTQSCCNSLRLILQGSSQECNRVNMSAGGAEWEYMLSQLSFYTRRHKKCGALYFKGACRGEAAEEKEPSSLGDRLHCWQSEGCGGEPQPLRPDSEVQPAGKAHHAVAAYL